MKNNSFSPLITGYDKNSSNREPNFFCRKISGRAKRRAHASPMSKISDAFAYTTFRAYGASFLVFGLSAISIQFAKTSLDISPSSVYSTLIIGIIASLLGAFLLAFDKPICIGFQEWRVADYILYDFLRISRTYAKEKRGIGTLAAVFFGMAAAASTYFFPAIYTVLAICSLTYIAISFASPEFSLFFTLIVLPIIPAFSAGKLILCSLVLICALSFWIKVFTGKRFYHFEQYDLVLFTMLFVMLISGIFLGGTQSFTNAVIYIILAFGYFAASNMIKNRRLYESALTSIVISSIPVSISCMVQFIHRSTSYPQSQNFTLTAFFTSSDALSAFLAISIICTYLMSKYKEKRPDGIFFTSILFVEVIALMLSFRIDALLSIAITTVIIIAASRNKKAFALTIIVYLLLSFASLFSRNILDWIQEINTPFAELLGSRVDAFTESCNMLFQNFFFGVGIGKEPFSEAILKLCGTTYQSSNNLILQLACEGGILVPILFGILMLIRAKHTYTYFPYAHKSLTSASLTMTGAVYALLLIGIFSDIFSDQTIFFIFFTVFGIGSAMLRTSKNEHDEKVGYFTDTLSLYSSSLNIHIND